MFSKLPRFKETVSDLPPVGAYDVKWHDTSTGPATFDRSGRFQPPQSKDGSGNCDSNDSSSVDGTSPAPSVTSGPVRPRQKSSTKTKGTPATDAGAAKIAELEKEIKRLITERNDLDSKLTSARQDITKLEGRLQQAIKDKVSLQAHNASLTKHNNDLIHGHMVKTTSSAQDAKRTAASLASELELTRQQLELNQEEQKRSSLEAESFARLLEEERSRSEARAADLLQQLQVANEARMAEALHVTELKSALSTLEESNQSLEEELANSQRCLETMDADFKVTSAELEKHVGSERALEGQVKELQTIQEKLQRDLDASNKVIADQADRSTVLEQAIASSSQEVQMLRDASSGLERQLASIQSELLKAKGDIERQEKDHQTAIADLTSNFVNCEEKLAQESRLNRENQAILKAQITSMEVSRKVQDEDSKKLLQALHEQLAKEEAEKAVLQLQVERLSLEAASKEEHFTTHLKEVLNINEELKVSKQQQDDELGLQLKQMSSDYQKKLQRFEEQLREERQIVLTLQTQLISSANMHKENSAVLRDLKCTATQTPASVDEEACQKGSPGGKRTSDVTRSTLADTQRELKDTRGKLSDTKLSDTQKELKDTRAKLADTQRELKDTQGKLSDTQKELKDTRAKLADTQRELKDTQGNLSDTQGKRSETQRDLEAASTELHVGESSMESSDLTMKISELEKEIERLQAENKQLKEDYAILEEKYRPYRDKLDALEELNQLLKSQTELAQSEAEKMSDQYAKLLGHQNSKQKILHVKKLKDENAALKLEITELKSEVTRHKRTIKRLEDEGSLGTKEPLKTIPQTKDPSKTLLPKN